jgi:hypothetical protein
VTFSNELAITIRPARPEDSAALRRLAALDSTTVPAGPLLVAELDGQIRVAVSVSDLRAIADPFILTAPVVDLMREHIKRRAEPLPRRRLLPRVRPALGARLA